MVFTLVFLTVKSVGLFGTIRHHCRPSVERRLSTRPAHPLVVFSGQTPTFTLFSNLCPPPFQTMPSMRDVCCRGRSLGLPRSSALQFLVKYEMRQDRKYADLQFLFHNHVTPPICGHRLSRGGFGVL